jgi:Septum formation
MARRVILLAGLAMIGLATGGCDRGGTVKQAGASSVFRLQTGECFHSAAGTAGKTVHVKDVSPLPCTEAHDGEVFAVFRHPAADGVAYPGDDAVSDFAAAECLQRFPGYTGGPYDNSDLEVATIRPDHDSWTAKDDREVACVLYNKGAPLTGSRRTG